MPQFGAINRRKATAGPALNTHRDHSDDNRDLDLAWAYEVA